MMFDDLISFRRKTGTADLREKAYCRVVHGRWVSRLLYHDLVKSGDPDCSTCRFLLSLSGPLGLDWGVCTNPVSAMDGRLLFEHQGCDKHKPDEDEDQASP